MNLIVRLVNGGKFFLMSEEDHNDQFQRITNHILQYYTYLKYN